MVRLPWGAIAVVTHSGFLKKGSDMADIDYKRVFDMLGDDGRKAMLALFLDLQPLNKLVLAAELNYDRPGVRRGQVMKQVKNHIYFKLLCCSAAKVW